MYLTRSYFVLSGYILFLKLRPRIWRGCFCVTPHHAFWKCPASDVMNASDRAWQGNGSTFGCVLFGIFLLSFFSLTLVCFVLFFFAYAFIGLDCGVVTKTSHDRFWSAPWCDTLLSWKVFVISSPPGEATSKTYYLGWLAWRRCLCGLAGLAVAESVHVTLVIYLWLLFLLLTLTSWGPARP